MEPVEARSLAALTELAANPPLQRQNQLPQHIVAPLILYIARVPGSRDIFLSPLKPRDRVVTAQDVESSLYYLHVNGQGGKSSRSASLVDTPPASNTTIPAYQPSVSISTMHSSGGIQRKPVPPARPDPIGLSATNRDNAPPDISASTDTTSWNVQDRDYLPITVIRRDPASGSQWNVASIQSPSLQAITNEVTLLDSVSVKSKSDLTNKSFLIEMQTPGYSQFASSAASRSAEERNLMFQTLLRPSQSLHGHPAHERSASSGQDALHPETGRRPSLFAQAAAAGKSASGGYTLRSPWGGACGFFVSGASQHLKCTHSVPSGFKTSTSLNVSELRFNLPTFKQSPKGDSYPTSPGSEPKRSSKFFRPKHRRNKSSKGSARSSFEDGGEDQAPGLDLSLGLEAAGGGFVGRQAKLGKLIIKEEGLQMLDLVVAANMGLFWKAYEKMASL